MQDDQNGGMRTRNTSVDHRQASFLPYPGAQPTSEGEGAAAYTPWGPPLGQVPGKGGALAAQPQQLPEQQQQGKSEQELWKGQEQRAGQTQRAKQEQRAADGPSGAASPFLIPDPAAPGSPPTPDTPESEGGVASGSAFTDLAQVGSWETRPLLMQAS